jgi:hypothetical protein
MFKGFGDFTTTGGLIEGMYDPEGKLQPFKLLALLRSYLHATQGTPLYQRFYTDAGQNGTFVGIYALNTTINAPTEVYFSQDVYYTEGHVVSILVDGQPTDSITVDASQRNYLKLFSNNVADNGKNVSVVITKPITAMHKVVATDKLEISYTI